MLSPFASFSSLKSSKLNIKTRNRENEFDSVGLIGDFLLINQLAEVKAHDMAIKQKKLDVKETTTLLIPEKEENFLIINNILFQQQVSKMKTTKVFNNRKIISFQNLLILLDQKFSKVLFYSDWN